jgi:serine/threonine-protein kinase SRPK3
MTLKVYAVSASVNREPEIYNRLSSLQSSHAGQSCLRALSDRFEVRAPDGDGVHICLLHPPLGISLDQLMPLLPDGVMSSKMARTTIRNILAALDFLHTEAHVIHTGR